MTSTCGPCLISIDLSQGTFEAAAHLLREAVRWTPVTRMHSRLLPTALGNQLLVAGSITMRREQKLVIWHAPPFWPTLNMVVRSRMPPGCSPF